MDYALPTTLFWLALVALSVLALTGYLLTTRKDRARPALLLAALMASVPCFELTGYYLGHILPRLEQVKLDQFAYFTDRLFGEPSFILGRFLLAHPSLNALVVVAYVSLGTAISITAGLYILNSSFTDGVRCVLAFVLDFALATPFYLAFPVAGPAHAFSGFPYHLPAVGWPHLVPFYGVPNGMPSIHTSTALLILYFARRSKVGTILATLYLALIVLATLGLGEHYLIDLVAAVPYTWMVLGAARRLEALTPVTLTTVQPELS